MSEFEYMTHDFPKLPSDGDISKDYNQYDYNRWKPGTVIRLYRVPWDDRRNVPDFSTDNKRSKWFAAHESKKLRLETYYYLNKNQIKLPIPATTLYNYNYILIDYDMPTVDEYKGVSSYSYGFFIDDFQQITPSVSALVLRLDIMGTFMRYLRVQGQLDRGHYAVKWTTTDEFFSNPIEHNESLCDDDVYPITPQTVKAQTFLPYGDGEPWLLIGLRADPDTLKSMGEAMDTPGGSYTAPVYYDTQDRFGFQYGVRGYEWNLTHGDFRHARTEALTGPNPDGVNGSGVYVYAVKGSHARDFMHTLASKASHVLQTCVGVMVCPGGFIGLRQEAHVSWLGFDLVVCEPVYDLDGLPIRPKPEDFGYPEEYRKYTKLYTSQYALMIMRDDQAHEVPIKLESCGDLKLQRRFISSYPVMKMQAWLSGYASVLADSHVSVINLDGRNLDKILPGVDYELQSFGFDVPVYAVAVTGSRVWAMNSMYAWDRIEALAAYHKIVRTANTSYENAKDAANVNKANTLRTNDTTQGNGHRTTEDARNNALDSARTANGNALRSNATSYGNALRSNQTAYNNAVASAYAGEQNAFASNATAQGNSYRALQNSVDNTNEQNKASKKSNELYVNSNKQSNVLSKTLTDANMNASITASDAALNNSNLGMDQMQDLKNGAATHQAAIAAGHSVVNGFLSAAGSVAGGGKNASVSAGLNVVGGLTNAAFGMAGNAIAVGDNNKIKEAQKLINSEQTTIQQVYNRTVAAASKANNDSVTGNANALSEGNVNIHTNLANKVTDNNRRTGQANADASRATGDGNASRTYGTSVANAQRSKETGNANAAASKSTGDANANGTYANAKVIAERNYATGIANIDRVHGNVIHNTDDSTNMTISNAAYSRAAAMDNAKLDLENAPLKRKYEAANAANLAPVMYGSQTGDPTPDVTGMRGMRVYYKTGTKGQVRRIATEFARYGYKWDTYINDSDWQIMSDYTYWKMAQADLNGPEQMSQHVTDTARSKMEAGFTVWADPDMIGKVNIYDNR